MKQLIHRLLLKFLLVLAIQGALPSVRAFYDPRAGRWINRDPIEEWGGFNLYDFVGNDPVDRGDVNGLDAIDYVPILGPLAALHSGDDVQRQMLERHGLGSLADLNIDSRHGKPPMRGIDPSEAKNSSDVISGIAEGYVGTSTIRVQTIDLTAKGLPTASEAAAAN